MQAQRDFQRVPTRGLAALGLSGLAQNIVGTCLGVHLFIFYTDAVGLSPLWISAALFAATLWDACFGIAMGHISDRTRWKWGRRRPFILLGALPFGLTFAAVLWPPAALGGAVLGGYLAVLLLMQFIAANFVHVPVLGLIPEMAQSYHERTRMAAWREALGNIGDLIGLLLPFVLRAALTNTGTNAVADALVSRSAYGITGLIGGVLARAALFATYRGTYEDPRFHRTTSVSLRDGIAALRGNQAFRVLSLTSALAALPLAFVAALFLYVLEYVAGITDPLVQGALCVANIAGALASYPFRVWIAKRRGKASSTSAELDLVGYRPHVAQSASALLGIKVLFAVPTTLLVIAAWFAFRRFPLTPERWAELAVPLDARRPRDGSA